MSCATQFHYEIVYKLLRLFFCKNASFHITLNVNIKEGRCSAERHCRTVLLLYRCKVRKVCPLDSFSRILCGHTDVIAVHSRHFLHLLQEVYLLEKLLGKTDRIYVHYVFTNIFLVKLFLLYKIVNTVKCYSAVVTDYSSSAVCIWQTCDYAYMTCELHLVCINSEHAVIMCCTVLEVFFNTLRQLVAVSLTRTSCHSDTAERIYSSAKRSVCLIAYDKLVFLIKICRRIIAER